MYVIYSVVSLSFKRTLYFVLFADGATVTQTNIPPGINEVF